ncbi:MAG: imelysin family protein, partial [Chloroflexota bacterium]
SIAFERLQVYRFQRVMPYMTQLDSSPPNIPFIEGYIDLETPGTINAEFIEFLGSSSKGLPALEYFIFGDDVLASLTEVQNRRDYAAGLAADIRRVADELVVEWTPQNSGYGDRFINADGEANSVRSSVSMVTNEMIAELEDVARFWLGGPLGYRDGGEPQPDLVEAPYSGTSTAKLIANLEGFQMALNGTGEAPSMADYLDFLGAELDGEPLSDVLNAQIDTTIAALQAIESPLHIAVVEDTVTVEAAYDEAVTLLRLVKTDTASQLGITVTFTDNDGD